MSIRRKSIMALLLGTAMLFAARTAPAQQSMPIGFPDAPGRETTLKLCFQCHADAMWRDHRQDRRGWEAVLYRMVGRGALWTQEEINTMAAYLAATYAPQDGKSAK